MKSDSKSNKNISGEKPTLIQIVYHLLPTEPKALLRLSDIWFQHLSNGIIKTC